VDPDVDGYTKTLNHRKIIRNTQKNDNLLKTKTTLKQKYKLSGVRASHLPCQGQFALLRPVSYITGYDILYLHTVSCPYSTATRYELVA